MLPGEFALNKHAAQKLAQPLPMGALSGPLCLRDLSELLGGAAMRVSAIT